MQRARANVAIKGTTSKYLILVELLNLTFAPALDVGRDANVKFVPLEQDAFRLNHSAGPVWAKSFGLQLVRATSPTCAEPLDLSPNLHRQNGSI